MYQQLLGYKVEEKLYLGVREQKRLNTAVLEHESYDVSRTHCTPDSNFQGHSNELDELHGDSRSTNVPYLDCLRFHLTWNKLPYKSTANEHSLFNIIHFSRTLSTYCVWLITHNWPPASRTSSYRRGKSQQFRLGKGTSYFFTPRCTIKDTPCTSQ
jgi:hypothetical protein